MIYIIRIRPKLFVKGKAKMLPCANSKVNANKSALPTKVHKNILEAGLNNLIYKLIFLF